ncbi:hypothetical protein BGZ83_000585 [Gryganskiella cystojenkinii]|nr:hypothetical protein BGZ83_000585 [Gryganskiella cystojenkinii]
MSQNIQNNNVVASTPSIQFTADTQDCRGRDQTAHAINGNNTTFGAPLVQVGTTESTKSERRRSSLAAFAERLRSKSRSLSRGRSNVSGGGASGRNSLDEGSRRSSTSSDGDPYSDVVKAQALFMEKLRTEQEKSGITTNCDGLPIPPASMTHGRRRSSVTQILGLDKHLLAR